MKLIAYPLDLAEANALMDTFREECRREVAPVFDLVLGERMHREPPNPRAERYGGECGTEGKFFQRAGSGL